MTLQNDEQQHNNNEHLSAEEQQTGNSHKSCLFSVILCSKNNTPSPPPPPSASTSASPPSFLPYTYLYTILISISAIHSIPLPTPSMLPMTSEIPSPAFSISHPNSNQIQTTPTKNDSNAGDNGTKSMTR